MLRRAIAVVLMSVGLAAIAADAPHFLDLDKNKDGYLTVEEVGVISGLVFDIADINRDGKLDEQEYYDAVDG